jgi:asparagine synthase (glutamine-hydrolysing)
MCGIAGGWSSGESRFSAERVLDALHHRGPNDRGFETYHEAPGTVSFAHTRLSIIDLSDAGHQPMHSSDGRYSLIYNGELYNYREIRRDLETDGVRFTSDSDTEVLLAAWIRWGQAGLVRFKGMFAFVVYDRQARTLTCVRDAFGIKPFFYYFDGETFAFASEVPALVLLLGRNPGINTRRAYDYLVQGWYDEREETFFEGIKHLPPSHAMTFDIAAVKLGEPARWWWPSVACTSTLSFDDAAERLRELFLDNVRTHLRSDVPLGAALSGGVDSSAVVCAMRHLEPDMPIHTFSYVARGTPIDEERWADLINDRTGAYGHKVEVSQHELAADLDDMIQAQGEPFGSTSIYAQYRVFKLARDQGITVTLDGQGADELLAGYDGYPHYRVQSLMEQGEYLSAMRFLRAWSQWPGRDLKRFRPLVIGRLVPGFVRRMMPTAMRRTLKRSVGVYSEPEWLRLDVTPIPYARHQVEDEECGRRVPAILRRSLVQTSIPSLLRHADRNAMRWSVESRVPFLTTDMAEFLLSLPEHYLISQQGETKHVFRAAMRGIVPDASLDRRDKIGFQTPEQQWLRLLRPQIAEWLEGFDQVEFIDTARVRAEVASIIEGRQPFSWQAWRLINFARWVQLTH